jgi:hypothetical protein
VLLLPGVAEDRPGDEQQDGNNGNDDLRGATVDWPNATGGGRSGPVPGWS